MAVYKMSRKAIAEYLSDTILKVKTVGASSGVGVRTNGDSTYKIKVVGLVHEALYPKVDTFLNLDESITVKVYLPGYDYTVNTEQLSGSYESGKKLAFRFSAEARNFEYTFSKSTVESYADFADAMDDLVKAITDEVSKDMNMFKAGTWNFQGIEAKITFDVSMIN